jgi:hypothetical protein
MKLLSSIRMHWKFYGLSLIIILLVISAILRVLTPPETPIAPSANLTENHNNSRSTFEGITFSGTKPQLPDKLTIFKIQQAPLIKDQLLSQLKSTFSLAENPADPALLIGPEYSLFISPADQSIILSKNTETEKFTHSVVKDQVLAAAQSFFQKNFPNIPAQPLEKEIAYLAAEENAQSQTEQTAAAVKIPFTYILNNYDLVYNNTTDYPFLLTVNAYNEVTKVRFYPQFFSGFTASAENKPLSVEQAVSDILNGKASIVSSYFVGDLKPLNLDTIVKGELQSVTIEYRADEAKGFVYPFYRFSGQITNNQGDVFNAEIITPAVVTK